MALVEQHKLSVQKEKDQGHAGAQNRKSAPLCCTAALEVQKTPLRSLRIAEALGIPGAPTGLGSLSAALCTSEGRWRKPGRGLRATARLGSGRHGGGGAGDALALGPGQAGQAWRDAVSGDAETCAESPRHAKLVLWCEDWSCIALDKMQGDLKALESVQVRSSPSS